MKKFKTAVVGTGFIGPVHIEALRRLGVHVAGILDDTPENSQRAQQLFGIDKAYASFDELLADPDIQVVHLAVPNILHYDMSKRALKAGKHVMCEKPLAMTSEESAELVALAWETGLEAAVCHNIRFYPLNIEARQRIAEGNLGPIHTVTGSYVQDWLLYDTDYNWRVRSDQGGALRALADIGTHWMDLVTSITGLEVEAVFADLYTLHDIRKRPMGEVETFSGKTAANTENIEIDTEDGGSVLFRFKGGAKGNLWVSQCTAGRKNCLQYEIAGAKHALAWNSESPNQLWIGHRNHPSEVLLRDPSLLSETARNFASFPGGHNEGFPDAFKQCFKAFYDAIASRPSDDSPMYPTFQDGHKEILLCEAILQSHQQEKWVEIGE